MGEASADPDLLRRLLRARDRVDAAPHEDWSVQRMARVSGVSEAHFARRFKDAFGVPPHRYVLSRRLQHACGLLQLTDLSVTTIAAESGWKSLGTFGRTFRDVLNESPTAYRRRTREAGVSAAEVPGCVWRNAMRPDLKIAVSEKRRRAGPEYNGGNDEEVG